MLWMSVTILSPTPSTRCCPTPLEYRVGHSRGSGAATIASGWATLISSPAARVPAEPGAETNSATRPLPSAEAPDALVALAAHAVGHHDDGAIPLQFGDIGRADPEVPGRGADESLAVRRDPALELRFEQSGVDRSDLVATRWEVFAHEDDDVRLNAGER